MLTFVYDPDYPVVFYGRVIFLYASNASSDKRVF
ncbi:hypothetical protein BN8_06030 [Fibrisoma limi BUZ 3]|uniref:Uncharacterized protein n=1 Tax=Fibrisoma limi BUZ 3 TaxID=1185876 RepID=I2GRX2_9BACT|nr:hypothetical protein BN8_06030 [Fibrisoma limi BUZ 3]